MNSLPILLIDDHAMFRSGMGMVLRSGMANVEVFEADSLDEAMYKPIPEPAVVLLDVQLQGLNGLECIAVLRQRWPQAAIIMLSSDATQATVRLALARGATAFVSKSDTPATMLEVIQWALASAGDGPALSRCPKAEEPTNRPDLTARQSEVLDLLCQGLPNKTIGRRLGISENTVRGHVQALLELLHVSGRSEAVYAARMRGLVS